MFASDRAGKEDLYEKLSNGGSEDELLSNQNIGLSHAVGQATGAFSRFTVVLNWPSFLKKTGNEGLVKRIGHSGPIPRHRKSPVPEYAHLSISNLREAVSRIET